MTYESPLLISDWSNRFILRYATIRLRMIENVSHVKYLSIFFLNFRINFYKSSTWMSCHRQWQQHIRFRFFIKKWKLFCSYRQQQLLSFLLPKNKRNLSRFVFCPSVGLVCFQFVSFCLMSDWSPIIHNFQ